MMMEPKITITSEESNVLNFTLSETHFSLANSLRRIVLSEIPTLVFRAFPHSESKIDIISNTTRLNNEIIKQRIGCIPIHITDVDFPYKEYVVEVDKKNDSDVIQLLTTEDFKVKNIETDKYLSSTAVKELFPPLGYALNYLKILKERILNLQVPLILELLKKMVCIILYLLVPMETRLILLKLMMFGTINKKNSLNLIQTKKKLISKKLIGSY